MQNISIFLLFLLLSFFACKKDEAPISGCMDNTAINYNPNAVIEQIIANIFLLLHT